MTNDRHGVTAPTRRAFLAGTATLATTALLDSKVWSGARAANDRIRVAVMGVRGRGRSHVAALLAQPDAEIAYLCDVDKEVLGPVVSQVEKGGGKAPAVVQDVRK